MINVLLYSPGLGYINRGFESLTREIYESLVTEPDLKVTLFQGTGEVLPGAIPIWTPKRTAKFYDLKFVKTFKYRQYLSYLLENICFSIPIVTHSYSQPCDIVYFSDAIPADILYALRKKIGGSFKFLFCNGAPASPENYMKYDYVQVMTPAQYKEAVEAGYPESHLFLIPQGLKCESFYKKLSLDAVKKQRQKWNLPADRKIILSVGAVSFTHKRMNWIIEEFSQLDPTQYFLWIVGQPEKETAQVKALAESLLKPGSYQFDVLPYSQVSTAYQISDYFALCSLNEGFGRVYIEAMAAQLPVIAHRNLNTEWILGENNLGLIDMTQKNELAKKIIDLQENIPDTQEQARKNQQLAIQKFDWKSLRLKYVEMCQEIASK